MATAPTSVLASLGDRVEAKEQSRIVGLSQLERIQEALENDQVGRSQEGLADWTANLDLLNNASKSREILVGVIGETGLGKNGKTFKGKITFKSYETVEAELDALKFELADLEETSRAQGATPDFEYDDRCAQATRQIRNVASWSRLTQDVIRKSSPAEIIQTSPAFSEIFRKGRGHRTEKTHKRIKAASKHSFIDLLQPYVASSKSELPGTKYWPLVEQVEIFLRSEVLRYGINLVDLPGVMDALESRAQIARNDLCRLEKRIVVTPATRAADNNKAAADLIFSAEHEFPTDYIRRICRELKDREEREEDASGEDDDFGGNYDVYKTGERRPRADEALTRRVRQRIESDKPGDGDYLSSVDTEELKSMLKYLCIMERNTELKQKVMDNLLATRSKNKKSRATADTLPTVYPVSSKAFQSFKRSTKSSNFKGFPDCESTGIPDLKTWLYQVSLNYREEWVDSDIHHIQVLFDAADGWNQGDHLLSLKLTNDEKRRVVDGVNRLSSVLKKIINDKVRFNVQQSLAAMKPLRSTILKRTNLARKTAKGEPELHLAVSLLDKAVKGWENKNPRANVTAVSRHEKTYWSTYRACARRNGGPFNRPARNGRGKSMIHWMDDVSHAFWQGHFTNWAYEFIRRIPVIKGKIRGTGLKAFTIWVKKTWEDERLPQSFRDLLKASTFKLNHLFEKYIADVRERVAKFQATSRAKRDSLQRAMADHMRPGYEAAMRHTGDGIMAKQTKEVRTHAGAIGYKMFEKVRDDLERELVSDIKKVPSDIARLWTDPDNGCGTLIKAEMTRLSDRLCAKKLSGAISAWRSEWQQVFIRLPVATDPLEEFEEVKPAKKVVKMEDVPAEEDREPFLPEAEIQSTEEKGC
ncbi:tat pathway signal sequence [Colletotrichum incanum]|uniref:Tat pathway signal sequence n=1 Tax=Colletotrichum incanum TaxID=1573173 RepID=A0A167B6A5_COLIC|nr:tat pathway signal sequence [Colletotrichum incanum]